MKKIMLALALVTCSAFAQDELTEEKKDRKAINSLMEVTRTLANHDLSCQSSLDCLRLPVGSRACGGPNGYVITSTHNPLLEEVKFLAEQTESRESAYNMKYGVFSICSIVPMPQASCINNICK